jgi:hypothetical protein
MSHGLPKLALRVLIHSQCNCLHEQGKEGWGNPDDQLFPIKTKDLHQGDSQGLRRERKDVRLSRWASSVFLLRSFIIRAKQRRLGRGQAVYHAFSSSISSNDATHFHGIRTLAKGRPHPHRPRRAVAHASRSLALVTSRICFRS